MENEEFRNETLPAIADDFLIQVADQAERRVDAVMKIKRVALKVTNARDWTDQNGNPYLQASGSEKIANLFNISWRIDEPICDQESDGHYTYAYKGYFSLGSRTIEAEGSRSSRDSFFVQYRYKDDKGNDLDQRQEIPISERTNRRDVKMAALTNLFGNGITRILGIRNLTWDDLRDYAGITKEEVQSVQYKKAGKPSIQEPKSKNGDIPKEGTKKIICQITGVNSKDGKKSDGKPYTIYSITGEADGQSDIYKTFSKTMAMEAHRGIGTPALYEITFTESKYGNDIVENGLKVIEPE